MYRIDVYEHANECVKELFYLELMNENVMTWWVVELVLNLLLCHEPPCCFPQMMYDLIFYWIVGRRYVIWIVWSKLMVEDDLPKMIRFRMP